MQQIEYTQPTLDRHLDERFEPKTLLHKERVETEKHCERAKKKRKLTSEKYLEFKARQNLSEKKHKELTEKKRKRSMEKKKGIKEKLNL